MTCNSRRDAFSKNEIILTEPGTFSVGEWGYSRDLKSGRPVQDPTTHFEFCYPDTVLTPGLGFSIQAHRLPLNDFLGTENKNPSTPGVIAILPLTVRSFMSIAKHTSLHSLSRSQGLSVIQCFCLSRVCKLMFNRVNED